MPLTRTRRQRLILRTAAASAVAAVAVIAIFLLKPAPAPYVPGGEVDGLTQSLGRQIPADYPAQVSFVDAAAEAGIDFQHFHGTRSQQLPEDMGSGAAWCDFDSDGDLDLFAVNEAGPLTLSAEELAASPAHNALFRNRGGEAAGAVDGPGAIGTFEEISASSGVDHRGCGQAAAWADYDNDGRPDLSVSTYGDLLLYRNRGNAEFAEVTAEAGVDGPKGFWSGLSWSDFDRDGDLDLYVGGYVKYTYSPDQARSQTRQYDTLIPASLNPATFRPERNLLFRNDGDGHFAEVAARAGIDNLSGRTLSASWCDFDGDGWPDVYVANDLSDNALFRNRGDGESFEDISHGSWVADYRGAMGLAVADWDSDGDEDLFVTHWIAQENALYDNMSADYRSAGLDSSAALRFKDVADLFGLGQVALDYVGWGTAFTDYDNDGRLDLLVVNGSTFQEPENPNLLVPMRPLLFWNRGPADGFYEVGPASGDVFGRPVVARGLAVADYDADGDADAFVNVNGGQGILLRNEGGSRAGNWLEVIAVGGESSNRDGIGARIRVVAQGREWRRQVGSSSSYYSQHALSRELFGLGRVSRVDTVEIIWSSGTVERYVGVEEVNRTVTFVEGAGRSLSSGAGKGASE